MGRGDNVEAVADENGLITIDNLVVSENLRNLYKYIRENGFLETIENCDRANMKLFSRDVFEKVCKREQGWQEPLPSPVVEMIETKGCGNARSLIDSLKTQSPHRPFDDLIPLGSVRNRLLVQSP